MSKEVPYLRDRVELELPGGGSVDWDKLRRTLITIMGGFGTRHYDFIIRHLTLLSKEKWDSLPKGTVEAVERDPTDFEVLRNLGLLFLRRVQLRRSPDPLRDCEDAIFIFDVCGGLERSWEDSPRATTYFHWARVVIEAASIVQSENPFAPEKLKMVRTRRPQPQSWLDEAQNRLNSAHGRSVGAFHEAVYERIKKLSTLRRSFK